MVSITTSRKATTFNLQQMKEALFLSPAVVMLSHSSDLASVLAVLLELDSSVGTAREEGIVDLVLLETRCFGRAGELVRDGGVVFAYKRDLSETSQFGGLEGSVTDVKEEMAAVVKLTSAVSRLSKASEGGNESERDKVNLHVERG